MEQSLKHPVIVMVCRSRPPVSATTQFLAAPLPLPGSEAGSRPGSEHVLPKT